MCVKRLKINQLLIQMRARNIFFYQRILDRQDTSLNSSINVKRNCAKNSEFKEENRRCIPSFFLAVVAREPKTVAHLTCIRLALPTTPRAFSNSNRIKYMCMCVHSMVTLLVAAHTFSYICINGSVASAVVRAYVALLPLYFALH